MPAAITIAEPALDMADAVVLLINDYAYAAPYVETEDEIFLKTVFPSRKHTAIYLKD